MGDFLTASAAAAAIVLVPIAYRPPKQGIFDTLPWFTMALAAFAALNPLGKELIKAVVDWSPTDWFKELWVAILVGAVLLLVLIGAIEYAIRSRRAREHARLAALNKHL
jgi:hypothetical protein